MKSKIWLIIFIMALSGVTSLSLAESRSVTADSCIRTLSSVNVVKISNHKPLDLKPLPLQTRLDLFTGLILENDEKPVDVLLVIDGKNVVTQIQWIGSYEPERDRRPLYLQPSDGDYVVNFSNGTKAYLSEIESIQLLDVPSLHLRVTNPHKPDRFNISENDSFETILSVLSEGHPQAMMFLMEIVGEQSEIKGTPTENEEKLREILLTISAFNIGGEQLIRAKDFFRGPERYKAKEFLDSLFNAPEKLVKEINRARPTGYPYIAVVPSILSLPF